MVWGLAPWLARAKTKHMDEDLVHKELQKLHPWLKRSDMWYELWRKENTKSLWLTITLKQVVSLQEVVASKVNYGMYNEPKKRKEHFSANIVWKMFSTYGQTQI